MTKIKFHQFINRKCGEVTTKTLLQDGDDFYCKNQEELIFDPYNLVEIVK